MNSSDMNEMDKNQMDKNQMDTDQMDTDQMDTDWIDIAGMTEAKKTIQLEIDALEKMKEALDDSFISTVKTIHLCKGRIVVTGMGKSGHVARKTAATMASVGIHAFFMHPGEALHGDLGIVSQGDLVMAFSYSGETDEVLALLPALRTIGNIRLLAVVGREGSSLEKVADSVILLPPLQEAFLNDVPTASTTVMMALGDAAAIAVAKQRGFGRNEFALLHPYGTLGKKMTYKVTDIMIPLKKAAVVKKDCRIRDAVVEMCAKPVGCVCIADDKLRLQGIFTDGDLRRLLHTNDSDCMRIRIEQVMNQTPLTVQADCMAADAAKIMKTEGRTYQLLPVIEDGRLVGVLHLTDVIESGILS